MKYYLSWSSSGLVNEYIKPCEALYREEPIKTLPLDGRENIVLDGVDRGVVVTFYSRWLTPS